VAAEDRERRFHVEVRQGRRRARIFNLDDAELRRVIVEPWRLGAPIELAGRRWERRDCRLRILAGPRLAAVDLAHGQGWNRAERTARDVTDTLLQGDAGAAVAVLAPDPQSAGAAAELLRRLGLEPTGWGAARRGILAWAADPAAADALETTAALLVCVADPPPSWLLDAGLALGALGVRAVAVQIDGGPAPAALRDVEIVALGPGAPPLDPLAARLRRAGCAVAGS
jgi:hypothetical protein